MSKKAERPPIRKYITPEGDELEVYDLVGPRGSRIERQVIAALENDGFFKEVDPKSTRWQVFMDTSEGKVEVANFDPAIFETSINPDHAIGEMMEALRREARSILMKQSGLS